MADPAPKTPRDTVGQYALKRFADSASIGGAIVLCLLVASHFELLPSTFKGGGVEFTFSDTTDAVKDLDGRVTSVQGDISTLSNVIDAMKSDMDALLDEVSTANGTPTPREPIFQQATRSLAYTKDQASTTSVLLAEKSLEEVEGYSWIGTFDPFANQWTDSSVVHLDGNGLTELPDELPVNTQLKLVLNLNVRERAPEDTPRYYYDQPTLGFADKGTVLTLIGEPIAYDRDGTWQIWAKVEAEVRAPLEIEHTVE